MIETPSRREAVRLRNDSSVAVSLSNAAGPSLARSSAAHDNRKRRRAEQAHCDSSIDEILANVPGVSRQFTVLEMIGEGTFSCVYKSHVTGNPSKLYALKHIVQTSAPGRISNELQCLQALNGRDYIIPVETCLRWNDNVVIVLPYFPHNKVTDYLSDMDVSEMRLYMRTLFIALRRVHSMAIIHRDVKPSNFLFNRQTKQFRLVDFGLAHLVPGIDGPIGSVTNYTPDAATVTSKPSVLLPTSTVRRSSRLSSPSLAESKQSGCASSIQDTRNLRPPFTVHGIKHIARNQLKTRTRPTTRESALPSMISHSSIMLDSKRTTRAMESKRTSRQSDLTATPFVSGHSSVELRLCPTRHKVSEVCDICCAKPSQNTPRAGTPGFRAPEVLMKSPEQSTAVDIWAAGVTMLCILSSRYPFFKAQNDMEALAQIVTLFGSRQCVDAACTIGKELVCSPETTGWDLKELCRLLRHGRDSTLCLCGRQMARERQECWVCLSDTAYDLLRLCLDLNPLTRITADQALSHPFLSNT